MVKYCSYPNWARGLVNVNHEKAPAGRKLGQIEGRAYKHRARGVTSELGAYGQQ